LLTKHSGKSRGTERMGEFQVRKLPCVTLISVLLASCNAGSDSSESPDSSTASNTSAVGVWHRTAHLFSLMKMRRRCLQCPRCRGDEVYNDPYTVNFGSGDWSAVICRATGTITGDMTIPDGTKVAPTGKSYDVNRCTIAKRDGDLLREETFRVTTSGFSAAKRHFERCDRDLPCRRLRAPGWEDCQW
jgi:hypothetical protein